MQAKGRLQCCNADGLELGASGGAFQGFEAWQTAGSDALTREGYVQAKGRLQCLERGRPGTWCLRCRVLRVLGVLSV